MDQNHLKIRVVQLISSWGSGGSENGLSLMGDMYDKDSISLLIVNFCPGNVSDLWWKRHGAKYISFPQKAPTLGCAIQLFKLLKREKPDVVDIYGLRMNLVGRIVAKLTGVPVILSNVRQTDDWRKWYHVWLDRITSIFVDMYVSNSEAGRQVTIKREKISAHKIKVIYNGVALNVFQTNVSRKQILETAGVHKPDKFVFLTAARFRYEKGHGILVKAIADYREQLEGSVFLFAGDGEYLQDIKDLTKQLGVDDMIKFLGKHDDIPALMKSVDCFILPSFFEGLPRSVAEAMAAGLPVIATNVSGTPELVDDGITGILVPPKNSEKLGMEIVKLKNNPQIAMSMGKAGFEKAQKYFDIKKVVEQTANFYRKLVQEKHLDN